MELLHELMIADVSDNEQAQETINCIRNLFVGYSPNADDAKIRGRIMTPGAHIDIFRDGDICAAFAVCVPICLASGETCLFRHGTIVSENYRSRGLYTKLLEIGLTRHQPDWHATRTQNPRVYETWRNFHGQKLRPSPDVSIPGEYLVVAHQVVRGAPFNPETFVVRDVYHKDRTGASYHICRNPDIRAMFEKELGVHDAFILLARL